MHTTQSTHAAGGSAPHPGSETTADPVSAEMATPSTMRAIVQRRYGTTAQLACDIVPVPQPGPGQVLLRVKSAGVDRGVWHLMAGKPYLVRLLGFGMFRPAHNVLGADVAGTVVAIGDGVDRLSVGDEVFGIARGSFAEYAVADEDKLATAPPATSSVDAAAIAVSGVTALHAIEDIADVQPGQRVLVLGGSGGVGSYAVQLAAARGAHVTAVASGGKSAFVRGLGAAEVIDYRRDDVTSSGRTFDAIIDVGGRTPLRRLRRILSPTGTLAIVGGEGGDPLTGGMTRQIGASLLSMFVSQKLAFFIAPEHFEPMTRVASRLSAAGLSPAVTRTYDLADAASAIDDLLAGRISGKAVIAIAD